MKTHPTRRQNRTQRGTRREWSACAPRRMALEQLEERRLLVASGGGGGGPVVGPQNLAPMSAAMLGDLEAAPAEAEPNAIVAAGGFMFFTVDAPADQEQLWALNGAGGGANLLGIYANSTAGPILPNGGGQVGLGAAQPAAIAEMTKVGGKLFYVVNVGAAEEQLWVSDGSQVGTVMLKDFNSPGTPLPVSYRVGDITAVNGEAFFSVAASTSDSLDSQLFKSDGTVAGTQLVDDLGALTFGRGVYYPNTYDSVTGVFLGDTSVASSPLVAVGGTLYFAMEAASADKSQAVAELYKSDGTTSGTVLVRTFDDSASGETDSIFNLTDVGDTLDLTAATATSQTAALYSVNAVDNQGNVSSATLASIGPTAPPTQFTDLAGTLYFLWNQRLWSSPGAAAAPTFVATTPATSLFVGASPAALFAQDPYGNAVYELSSDGTTLNQVSGGTVNGAPAAQFAVVGDGTVYLAGLGALGDDELWKSDAAGDSFSLVTSFPPSTTTTLRPASDASLQHLTAGAGSTVYFSHEDLTGVGGLWQSDGTAAGTRQAQAILPPTTSSDPSPAVDIGGSYYFTATDAVVETDSNGLQSVRTPPALWKTDGTPAGTVLLLASGSTVTISTGTLTDVGGKAIFEAVDAQGATQLWTTDGTAAGTQPLTSGAGVTPNSESVIGGTAYFIEPDLTVAGHDLWQTDGNSAGTRAVVLAGTSNTLVATRPPAIVALGGQTFAIADAKLYSLAAGQAALVMDLGGQQFAEMSPVVTGGEMFFETTDFGSPNETDELWISDGTTAGTIALTSLTDTPGSGALLQYDGLHILQTGPKQWFFEAQAADFGPQLWVTDGTAAGTSLVKSFSNTAPDTASFELAGNDLAAVNGKAVFFVATNSDVEIWSSDGTTAGTIELAHYTGNGASDLFAPFNNTVVFQEGTQLWATGGTTATTAEITDPGVTFSSTQPLDGKLTLDAPSGQTWITDGTAANTVQLAAARAGAFVLGANGQAFFIGDNTANGYQLWITDGTTAGTKQLTALPSGPVIPIANQAFVNGALYFFANDGVHGFEPWVSDGTAAGTAMIKDINPGANGSYSPFQQEYLPQMIFQYINGHVVFAAADGFHGIEPWVIVPATALAASGGLTLAATEGATATLTVATFTDPNGTGEASDYAASIQWGDGTSASAGTVSGPDAGGVFTVTGSHVYAEETATAATISVVLHRPGPADTTVTDAISVADAALNATASAPGSATEGSTFSGTLATFTDANPNASTADFTADVDWGDHSTVIAGRPQISESNGTFTVTSSHLYAEEGGYTATVTITDVGGATATAKPVVNVVDAALNVTAATITATATNVFDGAVATFTDPGGAEPLTDYGASVNWGDKTSATSSVISGPDAGGVFTITGSHTYAAAGTFSATVTVHHDSVTPDATVEDPVTVSSPIAPVSYTSPGGEVTVTVVSGNLEVLAGGTVIISRPLADVSAVTITGATGTANNFTLDFSNGAFALPGGGAITFNGGDLPATPSNVLAVKGGSFDTDVYQYTGQHGGSVVLGASGITQGGGQQVIYSNLTPLFNSGTANHVVFNLPDGTVDATLDTAAGGALELVSGNQTFEITTIASPVTSITVNSGHGTDTVNATTAFDNAFHGTLSVNGAANSLSLDGAAAGTLTATAGVALTAAVATFRDPNGAGAAASYAATIDWGDGASATPGTISGPDAGGKFTVSGSHTYTDQNASPLTVAVVLHRANASDVTVSDTVAIAPNTTPTPHERYVLALYLDVLGRVAEAAGLAYWSHLLDTGTAIAEIAAEIDHSVEYYLNFVVDPAYQTLLRRAPDAAGAQFWLTQLQTGMTDQRLEANFLASDEFFSAAGRTNAGWSAAADRLLLGSTDATREAGWLAELAGGKSRAQVALEITTGAAYGAQVINADYTHNLDRAADPAGFAFWLGQFTDGKSPEDILTGFIASAEYYQRNTD